jgi:hypothetical protein
MRTDDNHSPLRIAHDGYLVGYARLLGDGRAVWYPGRSQVGCVRMASELDVWHEEELLDGESYPLPEESAHGDDDFLLLMASVLLERLHDTVIP